MAEIKFKLPDVGEGVTEAEVVALHVKVGDMVAEDDPLLDVMTDKATVELPSPAAGRVTAITGEPGEVIPVGTVVVVIETDADAVVPAKPEPAANKPAPVPAAAASAAPASAPAPAPALIAARAPSPAKSGGLMAAVGDALARRASKALASPAVRQAAREADLDINQVPGTGPAGRVTRDDLADFIAAGGRLAGAVGGAGRIARTEIDTVKVIGLRRKISENMMRAWAIPHITYADEIDVTALEALRQHLNGARAPERPKLTLLPFLCLALAKALPEFPNANAHYDAEAGTLTRIAGVHVGVATATDKGLIVPVLRHAEARDVWDMAAEIKRLSDAVRAGVAAREELTGSSITITSLGALGGLVTTPILNAPETTIIGVNKMVERPAFDAGGRVVPRLYMNLSSSFDHRIVDGYEAARLVQTIKGLLEHPATIFM